MINTDNNTFIYLDNSDYLYEYLSFKEFQKLEVNNDNNNIWIEGAYFIEDEEIKKIDVSINNEIDEQNAYDASYYLEDHKDAPEWELLYNDYLSNIEKILSDYQNIDFDISKILDIF